MKQKTDNQFAIDQELFKVYNALTKHKITLEQSYIEFESLIEQGANIDAINQDGTPLLFVVNQVKVLFGDTGIITTQRIIPEVTRFLLSKGANMDILNAQENHILHICAKNRLNNVVEEIIDLYVKQNNKLEFVNYKNQTIAHIAAANNDSELIGLINKTETNINIQDVFGNTPLHLAVIHWFKGLLKNNPSYTTPYATIYKLFENEKIDPTKTNIDGKTALDIARDYDRKHGNKFQTGELIERLMQEISIAAYEEEVIPPAVDEVIPPRANPCFKGKRMGKVV